MDADTKLDDRESANDAYAHVGQRLRKLRLERGMTQAQVARIVSVSPQQYQKYEEAQSKCSLNYLIILAEFFETPVSTFLPDTSTNEVKTQEPPRVENEADLLARLVTAFVRLDDSGEKLRLVQLVEAIGSAKDKSNKV
ncbi:transcriptional regulator with XRE-family HTH domain [Yoonia maricola]|uniref:Transcriptional regulator with XRE-family HTH domain n=1 Tax=Yoonia maricola TaxID=420999 RepID=A0A2M8WKT8_9RHOB|nr:helix-turn-helix transcriptional regulator [Yoonia maricola]PJI91528.1 transcriptional regulator with XRE-family HTH domain [Yoonia maricola]